MNSYEIINGLLSVVAIGCALCCWLWCQFAWADGQLAVFELKLIQLKTKAEDNTCSCEVCKNLKEFHMANF